ncbi:ATP-binding cassette domain-containing protein [Limosilactobacillus sp. RRLNB_1_1]|uniref:ATP-binding cassette domain-containing protein n=1 Tax=Limosilactobacillus albertensis TaxID=2759752 RepID=A0A7W3TSH7_9LACO|nr:ABC transporter ATP-binding protein/permease [Limosilactobacillus albertensis]MBB1070024.1 ATP-binding cassette domain-containing protein [Limosilactobacillus albertensis]MBB1124067.1 ATP-binding cassette domain-containing protein [Limosilactobacillus albertensis]MCD7117261.1 ATP-binding cassette domain-containing protein [Limosilactobacillus albertensis]MCD7122145.1 ATP-binding cassette domain-containing protein [Limosilactobacillus albertensis]MCD7128865.1 ATP-binding cassette domain-cont
MAFLELKNIHKSYYLDKEEFPVLKGINLQFNRGEFVSILGESGGGKSTLMNIIGGLDRNFEGEVLVNGKLLDHKKEKQLDSYRRATVGYIYQSYNLISHLTVLDNVLVALDMTTLTKEERKKRALTLLDKVGLSEQVKKHPNHLSGGQKQRVAIARALASDPQIIIADEPTGALDSQNTKEVLALLDEIARDGKLVIAVTHSQEVADNGTRIVHLADGKIDGDTRLHPAYPIPDDPTKITPRVLPAMASYRTAFKHFIYNFWRNSLIMLGTAIGIFAVLLFSGLGNGINGYIQNQINSLANPQAVTVFKNPTGKKMTQEQIQSSLGRTMATDPQSMTLSDHNLKRLSKIKNVSSVEPGITVSAYQATYNGNKQSGTSLQTWSKSVTSSSIKQGHKPGNGEIVLAKQQAIQLSSAKNYKKMIGKTIDVSFNWVDKNNNPVPVQGRFKVSGISEGASSVTAITYATMVERLNKANASTAANFATVNVNNLDNVQDVAAKIDNLRDTNNKRVMGAITVGSILKTVNTYVSLASTVLAAIAGISLLVSALMIIVTMYMSVSERTKEIGILRALGERKKDIRRLFTSESVFIGFFSAILALVIVGIVALLLNHALYGLIKYNIVQITVGNVIFAIVIAIVISFVAALLPARRAANLNPIDALAAD